MGIDRAPQISWAECLGLTAEEDEQIAKACQGNAALYEAACRLVSDSKLSSWDWNNIAKIALVRSSSNLPATTEYGELSPQRQRNLDLAQASLMRGAGRKDVL